MGRLTERIETARRALATLEDLVGKSVLSVLERDAALQRFEYSFEAIWKAAQLFLREIEGLEVGSPKATVRAAFRADLLDETEAREALAMADDRNLTVHAYDEKLAAEIAARLPRHARVLRDWLDRIAARADAA